MMLRYLAATPFGLAVTLALLLSMQALIESGSIETPGKQLKIPILFGRVVEPEPVPPYVPEARYLPPVTLPDTRPPVINDGDGIGVPFRKPTAKPGEPVMRRIDLNQLTDGPLVHMVRVSPSFPPAAVRLGIGGLVTVQFDVTADGRVANPIVIESSHSVFESAALKAALKFRFKPKVADGMPVPVNGIQYRFRFELDD